MRFVIPIIRAAAPAVVVAALAGCSPDYSPDTYSGVAVQQANKVDSGIVIGYREVKISADGSIDIVLVDDKLDERPPAPLPESREIESLW